MASPSTLLRAHVKTLLDTAFTAEGWTVENDRFGRSAGMEIPDTGARIACYPLAETPVPGKIVVLRVPVMLQFHLGYTAEPDETIVRDPAVIEALADRVRRVFNAANSTGLTNDLWFLNFGEVSYPPDPTGNITRFEAVITGTCSNPAALA